MFLHYLKTIAQLNSNCNVSSIVEFLFIVYENEHLSNVSWDSPPIFPPIKTVVEIIKLFPKITGKIMSHFCFLH